MSWATNWSLDMTDGTGFGDNVWRQMRLPFTVDLTDVAWGPEVFVDAPNNDGLPMNWHKVTPEELDGTMDSMIKCVTTLIEQQKALAKAIVLLTEAIDKIKPQELTINRATLPMEERLGEAIQWRPPDPNYVVDEQRMRGLGREEGLGHTNHRFAGITGDFEYNT